MYYIKIFILKFLLKVNYYLKTISVDLNLMCFAKIMQLKKNVIKQQDIKYDVMAVFLK